MVNIIKVELTHKGSKSWLQINVRYVNTVALKGFIHMSFVMLFVLLYYCYLFIQLKIWIIVWQHQLGELYTLLRVVLSLGDHPYEVLSQHEWNPLSERVNII